MKLNKFNNNRTKFFREDAAASQSIVVSEVEDEPPLPKKRKQQEVVAAELLKLGHVQKKIVKDVNMIYAMSDYTEKIDSSSVKVSMNDGKLAVSVACKPCGPNKYFAQHCTKYTADANNYKNHFARCHLKKGETLKEGCKFKLDKQQPKLPQSFFKGNQTERDPAADNQANSDEAEDLSGEGTSSSSLSK